MHEEVRDSQERAFLVALELPDQKSQGWKAGESLDELERLVDTAGGLVVGREIQGRQRPESATYIGSGKAEELARLYSAELFDMVIFDAELSPIQQRNLETELGCPVLDRTTVILDIFAQRARSREAKLQVELAQLQYRLPRLTGTGTSLSRLGGGIGTRGPGETKLEVDRRRIRDRVAALKQDLAEIQAHRERLRRDRSKSPAPVVALTGYTNAGKSTLHRTLSGSDVLAEDRLFATLDATTRRVEPADAEPYLLVDTVGFIHNLPTFLVAAFRSTLSEVKEADLLLHVIDSAHPKRAEQMATVDQVLLELKANDVPSLLVFNKAELLDPLEREAIARRPDAVCISALTGEGLTELQARVQSMLANRREVLELVVPYAKGGWVAWAHERGRIIAEEHREEGTYLKVELERGLAGQLQKAVLG
ncbi:MAG TPA: GTPase HflX [Symbiobacteriaceae bacterium]|nr:GTPase HflX [Symbiobacteriaceae bacterium]